MTKQKLSEGNEGAARETSRASTRAHEKIAARWNARIRLMGVVLALLGSFLVAPTTASAQDEQGEGANVVSTESELRAAWADPLRTSIVLGSDIYLHQCKTGDPIRESARPMMLD